ncbi:Rne/Rng family ribonuclease [Chroococcidiopsis thermalis]|uniref:Ribonuclease, Rne/Rng family n=1 Tax=Chroococcidiopsis thermalis (strain PCC 7203) TaxID=251229 RepID=K9U4P9_CHRTP|nr:Rne/Rng family ribonuclease [Chroococcidiopsis thermalis]AFY89770.1 ribonuclease, Rne/Rng family [Chroococcidiopsis thermalis PCC 7203]
MPKQIIIAEQHHIAAVFSEDQIQELVVATGRHQVGDIYLGVVENVLPGIDAAFVNIGDSERNGFIHVTDLGPLKLKRTAAAITELLAPQQKVLVQVMKEPTGNKGPRLTGNITLPSRYVVLMPFGRGVNLSQRIRNENERNRLRALAILIKPAGMGLLIRTEAEGKPEEAIIEDLEAIQKQWEEVLLKAQSTRAPSLLNRDDDFIQRVLRDMYGSDVNRIVVDSATGLKRVKQYLMNWGGGQPPQGLLIDHHRDRIPILEYFRINAAIREALKPRVELPSGGYIIIQPTEALTVIDVNSGSFTRSATARETVLWTNCEAATEIARQLRLRNLAGVIVVDFIDMESRRDQLQVLEHFNKALRADKARPQIAQLSELGLVELTRKRQGQNIYELFGRTCPTCGGLGHVVHLPGESEEREVSMPPAAREPEWSAPQPARDSYRVMPNPRSVEPRESSSSSSSSWGLEAESFSNDFDSDRQDLMPINHPNYQEIGDAAGNNRRRRRRRIGEGGYKEENPRATANSLTLLNDRDTEPEVESEGAIAAEVSYGDRRDAAGGTLSRDHRGWVEKPERSKPIKPEPVKVAIDPPETIVVEMTPEEQEIYAVMGVSPLVRLDREVKNPKSAIVQVVLPGQAPPLPQSENGTMSDSEVSTINIDSVAAADTPVIAAIPEITESELPATVDSETDRKTPVRRRRRRSSADGDE